MIEGKERVDPIDWCNASIPLWNQSLQTFDKAVGLFNKSAEQNEDPHFSEEQLEQIYSTVKAEVKRLKSFAEAAKEREKKLDSKSCCAPSNKSLWSINIFKGLSKAASIAGAILAFAKKDNNTAEAVGIALFGVGEFFDFFVTYVESKHAAECLELRTLSKLSTEGAEHAEIFKNFIYYFKKIKALDQMLLKKISQNQDQLNFQMKNIPKQPSQVRLKESNSLIIEKDTSQYPEEPLNFLTTQKHSPIIKGIDKTNLEEASSEQLQKLLEKSMILCLDEYQKLPTPYAGDEMYCRIVSHFIQKLPENDKMRQAFNNLTKQETNSDFPPSSSLNPTVNYMSNIERSFHQIEIPLDEITKNEEKQEIQTERNEEKSNNLWLHENASKPLDQSLEFGEQGQTFPSFENRLKTLKFWVTERFNLQKKINFFVTPEGKRLSTHDDEEQEKLLGSRRKKNQTRDEETFDVKIE